MTDLTYYRISREMRAGHLTLESVTDPNDDDYIKVADVKKLLQKIEELEDKVDGYRVRSVVVEFP